MIAFIFYIVGVIISYLVIGIFNIKRPFETIENSFCLFSWLFLIVFLLVNIAFKIIHMKGIESLKAENVIQKIINLFKK